LSLAAFIRYTNVGVKINDNEAGRTRSTKGATKNVCKMLFEKTGRIRLESKFMPI